MTEPPDDDDDNVIDLADLQLDNLSPDTARKMRARITVRRGVQIRTSREICAAAALATDNILTGPLNMSTGGITALVGNTGLGKTFLTLSAAVSIVENRDLIGCTVVRPGNVLIVENEGRDNDLLKRLQAVYQFHGIKPRRGSKILTYSIGNGHPALTLVGIDDEGKREEVIEDHVEELVEQIEDNEVVAVFLDPMITLSQAGEENNANSMKLIMSALDRIAGEHRAAVLFAHHTPKGDAKSRADNYAGSEFAARGSGAIAGYVTDMTTLAPYMPRDARTSDRPVPGWVRLDVAKARNRERSGDDTAYMRMSNVQLLVRDRRSNLDIEESVGVITPTTEDEALGAWSAREGENLSSANAVLELINHVKAVGEIGNAELNRWMVEDAVCKMWHSISAGKKILSKGEVELTINQKLVRTGSSRHYKWHLE